MTTTLASELEVQHAVDAVADLTLCLDDSTLLIRCKPNKMVSMSPEALQASARRMAEAIAQSCEILRSLSRIGDVQIPHIMKHMLHRT
jgi:hypothetical protein